MKVKFLTLGCKVNQYETQGLIEDFLSRNCEVTDGIADLYVINTCSVTHRADVKSRDAVRRAKRENPKAKIAVCGCLVQLDQSLVTDWGVDYIVPQDKKYSLVSKVFPGQSTDGQDNWSLKISKFFNHRAFLKIQDGCDNFCSFCKVPYLRGSSRSRNPDEVTAEARRLCVKHKELVLCGVNLGLYGRDLDPRLTLSGLIDELLKIDSLTRLRLSSLDPSLIDDHLLSLLNHPRVCPHLHLPFQSGDDLVLKGMNKKETVSGYERVVKKAREINPLVAISCDIMTGFPAEDDKSFSNTVNFLNRVKPMRMHIFTFSPREHTPLARVKLRGHRKIHNRHAQLRKLGDELAKSYALSSKGKVLHMVAEETNNGYVGGYTENYLKVSVKEKLPLGDIIPVRIEEVLDDKILAKICD